MKSKNIAALFMEKLYDRNIAVVFTGFILWTSMACVFAATLGYSRIPYAAARRGDFFPIFAYLHPTGNYPLVSLAVFGVLTAAFCFLDLATIVNAAVCVRIGVQFIGQIIGLHLLRTTRPDVRLPFRMWLYPLPSLIALGGWLYVLATADRFVLLVSVHVLIWGVWVFVIWTIFARPLRSSASAVVIS